MAHGVGGGYRFLFVGLNLSAWIGVQPNQVRDGGMIGMGFESVWHFPKSGGIF
jgi:hypothetical protein